MILELNIPLKLYVESISKSVYSVKLEVWKFAKQISVIENAKVYFCDNSNQMSLFALKYYFYVDWLNYLRHKKLLV